jgi:aryl-phospho-beta-D-glucosidase BglC (GH1 family)
MTLFSFSWARPAALVGVLTLSVLAVALVMPGTAAAAPVTPWVQAQNGHFVDTSSGKSVLLRGFDVVAGSSTSQKAVTVMGANFVRITPSWEEIEPNAPVNGVHTYDQTYLSNLDQQVQWAQAHNLNVMIDMHQTDWSSYFASVTDGSARGMPPWLYSGNPSRYPVTQDGLANAQGDFFTDPQIKQWYTDLWTMMVNRYSSYPNVVGFEVINEPRSGTIDSSAATQTLVNWQSDLAHTIASLDPQATIFFMPRAGADLGLETADFSSFNDLPHVAVDLHDYSNGVGGITADGESWLPTADQTHNQSSTNYQGTIDQQEGFLARAIYGARSHGWPLLVGEWGVRTDDSGATTYQDQMLQLFARYGLSWARWNLSTSGQFATMNPDYTPNAEGQQLQTALASTPSGEMNDGVTPTITGTPAFGTALTATKGSWTSTPSSATYQWYRCDSLGNSCVAISGATGSSYTVAQADADMRLRVRVSVTSSAGSSTALSPATVAAPSLAPSSSAVPTISGQAIAGQVLTASTGTWVGKVTSYAYQWMQDGNQLSGATKASYTAKTTDVGHQLSVQVTATGSGGSTAASSAPTAAIAPAAIANTIVPKITGSTVAGSQLTADKGTWTGTITGYSYQWMQDSTPISGATNSHYTLLAGDVGHTISLQVTATGPSSSLTATSAATAKITAVAITNTTAPTITGTAVSGTQLTGNTGSWTGTITGYTYQWMQDSTPISGATNSHYTLNAGNVGHTISLQVTAAGPSGTLTKTSATTATVADLAPKNTAAPTLSGTATVGSTLTINKGTWTGSNLAYSYRWTRVDANGNATTISGQTSTKYKLTSADTGYRIIGYAAATNTAGTLEAGTPSTATVA